MRKRGDYFLFVLFWVTLYGKTICELNCGHFDAYADDVPYFLCYLFLLVFRFSIRPAKIIEWNLIMSYGLHASTYSYLI